MDLVPGRDCGECTACCKFIPIKTEMLEKPTNTLCPHCVLKKGCSVYDQRPSVCRGWFCGWRYIPSLLDHWRPDLSGIVVRLGTRTDEEGYTLVVLDHTKLMLTPEYPAFVDFCVRNNINLALQAVGPMGHFPVTCDLNTLVAKAVQERDGNAILVASLEALKSMFENHSWESDGLTMRSSLSANGTEPPSEQGPDS